MSDNNLSLTVVSDSLSQVYTLELVSRQVLNYWLLSISVYWPCMSIYGQSNDMGLWYMIGIDVEVFDRQKIFSRKNFFDKKCFFLLFINVVMGHQASTKLHATSNLSFKIKKSKFLINLHNFNIKISNLTNHLQNRSNIQFNHSPLNSMLFEYMLTCKHIIVARYKSNKKKIKFHVFIHLLNTFIRCAWRLSTKRWKFYEERRLLKSSLMHSKSIISFFSAVFHFKIVLCTFREKSIKRVRREKSLSFKWHWREFEESSFLASSFTSIGKAQWHTNEPLINDTR